mmetsp:Transcript_103246/g.291555  ORF Transcript_103246/g.291555 Transcript_103246/m.291555 type:complete len:213 (-) Transcript_103246:936-1574(-)
MSHACRKIAATTPTTSTSMGATVLRGKGTIASWPRIGTITRSRSRRDSSTSVPSAAACATSGTWMKKSWSPPWSSAAARWPTTVSVAWIASRCAVCSTSQFGGRMRRGIATIATRASASTRSVGSVASTAFGCPRGRHARARASSMCMAAHSCSALRERTVTRCWSLSWRALAVSSPLRSIIHSRPWPRTPACSTPRWPPSSTSRRTGRQIV